VTVGIATGYIRCGGNPLANNARAREFTTKQRGEYGFDASTDTAQAGRGGASEIPQCCSLKIPVGRLTGASFVLVNDLRHFGEHPLTHFAERHQNGLNTKIAPPHWSWALSRDGRQ
jgi:hypothetical protein